MSSLRWTTIHDPRAAEQQLRIARYGVIEFRDGDFQSIRLRPWPKFGSLFEVWWCETLGWRRRAGDCCQVFYSEPSNCPGYLTLSWMRSTADTRLKTVYAALNLLDEIADVKQSDAIVCQLANQRISDRLMRRLGWAAHLDARKRHYIKRFDRATQMTAAQQKLAAELAQSSVGELHTSDAPSMHREDSEICSDESALVR